jgi:hypothetical protein
MDGKQSVEPTQSADVVENNQPTYAQRRFYSSARCEEARRRLQDLVDNPEYDTSSSSTLANHIPFIERHLNHLSMYPNTNLDGYISNLKLMTSLKRSGPAR